MTLTDLPLGHVRSITDWDPRSEPATRICDGCWQECTADQFDNPHAVWCRRCVDHPPTTAPGAEHLTVTGGRIEVDCGTCGAPTTRPYGMCGPCQNTWREVER